MNKKHPKKHPRKQTILRSDGTFNVQNKGLYGIKINDLYHSLITLGLKEFVAVLGVLFILINLCFASVYSLLGPGAIAGIDPNSKIPYFLHCFFFSIQTFATIGYGGMSPHTLIAHIIVSIEAFFQVLILAVTTGLIFSRFAKPKARILFSTPIILGDLDGDRCLFFRIANERFNQIVDAEVTLLLMRQVESKEGQSFRVPIKLSLEYEKLPLLALSWTVCHIIDKSSPLYNLDRDGLQKIDAEFMVTVSGTDTTLGQRIHTRHSYALSDLLIDELFVDVIERKSDGSMTIDLAFMHETKKQSI